MVKQDFNDVELKLAFKVLENDTTDVKPISIITPRIVNESHSTAAYQLVTSKSKNRDEWQAEAFALFNTPSLKEDQFDEMITSVIEDSALCSRNEKLALSQLTAKLGRYCFSFPQWRFTSQGFNGASLIERFGLKKLQRDNDVRSPELPKFNPERDEYGIGFVWHKDDWSIEHRRSYVLVSNRSKNSAVTIVMRNSSYFYGRDRLSEPASVSFEKLAPSELEAIDNEFLTQSKKFIPWKNVVSDAQSLTIDEKISRVTNALNFIDDFDSRLSLWLTSPRPLENTSSFQVLNENFAQKGGLSHLIEFMKVAQSIQINSGKTGSFFYLVEIDEDTPPWKPKKALPVSDDLISSLNNYQDGHDIKMEGIDVFLTPAKRSKVLLLSGPDGDFPVKPKPKAKLEKTTRQPK